MGLTLNLAGEWYELQAHVQHMKGWEKSFGKFIKTQLKNDADNVLETLQGHIDNQDLDWPPLSDTTIEVHGGDTLFYVDSGELRDSLVSKQVKPLEGMTPNGYKTTAYFIGAPANRKHKSGMSMAELMAWLEYGTDRMPPRPLIEPTYKEICEVVVDTWKEIFEDFIKGV